MPNRLMLFLSALLLAMPAAAVSNHSAEFPGKGAASLAESLRVPPGGTVARLVRLDAIDPARIAAARHANAASWQKRLQIGVGREVPPSPAATSSGLSWQRVPGGLAAHWEVSSPGAVALRVGLSVAAIAPSAEVRFRGLGEATVYGPFHVADLFNGGDMFWSPVLQGDSAIAEIYVADAAAAGAIDITVAQVSHLFANPSEASVETQAKDGSQLCEVDLICRSATDAALASTGKAVARMTFLVNATEYLCTGTLLNPTDGSFIPYFYSAHHCINTQAVATTLTTHWFYDRAGCGSGGTSAAYRQVEGGATILHADEPSDSLLLRLNGTPPAGAVFAAWNADAVPNGTALTGVHHPAGDWKKVSLATMGGFLDGVPGGPAGSFIVSNWNSAATGVTEGGSSGSGIFTAVGSPATEYQLRGGLFGGPSSCAATGINLRDFYSRFDLVFPSIAKYLNPPTTCSYALSPQDLSVGPAASQGSFAVTTSDGCAWTATSNAAWLTTTSSGTGSGTVVFAAAANAGAARTGTIAVAGKVFSVSQSAATGAGTARLINISTRGKVETGNDVMIGGFVIGGSLAKKVLITARGPSLGSFGIANPLANPKIELFVGQTKLLDNDDWQTQGSAAGGDSAVAEIQATGVFPNGLAPSDAKEAALMVTLNPGAYTAIVSGADGGTGVGIVEVFAQDKPDVPLANISTRGKVLTGDDRMIGGFVIQGATSQTVLITARGPSLTDFGITNPLANPKLEIFSGQTKVFENDDWETNDNKADIAALGTFPTGLAPSDAKEAALLVTLPPGAYTAIVSGVNNGTGVGIVEVFAR